jgi:membrane-associated phospholipid phosphatase
VRRPQVDPRRRSSARRLLKAAGDLDRRLLLLARTRGHRRWAERAIGAYSRTGEHAAVWLGLGVAGWRLDRDPARRAAWRRGVRLIAAAYALNYAVKITVRRRRPELPGLPPLTPTVSRLSFPSAHATTSFAAARAYRSVAPRGALYGAAGMFALSRPYLGVHYPSDVLVGALLGTAVAEAWPSADPGT